MRRFAMPFFAAIIAAALLSADIPAARAQESGAGFAGIEEVIVTARKREETLQDVPIALTVFDVRAIRNFGVSDAKDLGNALPGLQTPSFPTSNNNLGFFIRGTGNADSNILTRDNTVGLYFDGVYMGRTTGVLADLVDLERIEVLRGPQGTLYGRNTIAGAINFVSAEPAGQFSIREEISVGNYNYLRSRLIVDLPEMMGGLKTKISIIDSDRDGWVRNEGSNVHQAGLAGSHEDYYQNRQTGVRLFALFEPDDQWSARYVYDYSDMETTPQYYQYYGAQGFNVSRLYRNRLERTKSPITGGRFAYELQPNDTLSEGHSLTLEWVLSDQMTFKSITGFRRFDSDQFTNFAQAFFAQPIPPILFAGGAFDFTTDILIENKQFTQEFQLTGEYGEVEYVAGFYYLDENGSYTENQIQTFGPVPLDDGTYRVDSELESFALFGQATWAYDERLDLSLGLRYTEDDRSAERKILQVGLNGFEAAKVDIDFDKVDYSLTANYAYTDEISAYIRHATGFRSGGASPRAAVFSVSYDEETLTSWEVGVKSRWLDNHLRLNVAVFFSDYEDVILDFADPDAPGKTTGLNAGEGEVDGYEVEALYVLSPDLRLGLNYTYINAEITDVNEVPAALNLTGVSNFEFLWAPHHAYSAYIDYNFSVPDWGAWSLHLDYSWQDDQFSAAATDLGRTITGSFGQWNGRLSMQPLQLSDNASLQFALWAKNLTDEDDVNYNLLNQGFAHQEPRRYGLDIIWSLK